MQHDDARGHALISARRHACQAFTTEDTPRDEEPPQTLSLTRGNSTDAVAGEGVVWQEMLRGASSVGSPGEEGPTSLSDRLRSSTAQRIHEEGAVWSQMTQAASLSMPERPKHEVEAEARVWAQMSRAPTVSEEGAGIALQQEAATWKALGQAASAERSLHEQGDTKRNDVSFEELRRRRQEKLAREGESQVNHGAATRQKNDASIEELRQRRKEKVAAAGGMAGGAEGGL